MTQGGSAAADSPISPGLGLSTQAQNQSSMLRQVPFTARYLLAGATGLVRDAAGQDD